METHRRTETCSIRRLVRVLICTLGVIAQAGLVWSRAPLRRVEDSDKRVVGQYIVVLKLRNNEYVDHIQEDSVATLDVAPASWGLDRIDERNRNLDNRTSFLGDGSGVHIYVVDTGIRYTHEEFTGRTGVGYNAVDDGGRYDQDCHGHGTHCAGVAAGARFGVARNATVHAVRVLNCTGRGSTSSVIQGLEWVAQNGERPAVVSMSISGPPTWVQFDAVESLVNEHDVSISVSAGNDATYACLQAAAFAPSALTVGMTDINDTVDELSNYGSCVDMFAPGVAIPSAFSTSDTAQRIATGTSVACPHVAGSAAILLGLNNALKPTEVGDILLRGSTPGKTDHPFAPDRLLYIGQETCMLRCGDAEDGGQSCQCDPACEGRGDCCSDYVYVCGVTEPTCQDRCDSAPNASYPCQCDEQCEIRQDCCPDQDFCTGPFCVHRCGEYNETWTCQCNDVCPSYGDCCHDKLLFCGEAEELCTDTIRTTEGSIRSHNTAGDYPNNVTCTHHVTAPSGYVVNLVIRNFDVEVGDGLTIYDGEDKEEIVMVEDLSGSEMYWLMQSTGRHVLLVFKTDGSGTAGGFEIGIFFRKACQQHITEPAAIASTNFPANYDSHEVCLYTITSPPDHQVLLSFDTFRTQCTDGLYLYDGAHARGGYRKQWCGSVTWPCSDCLLPSNEQSFSNAMTLSFITPSYSLTDEGFHATLTFDQGCSTEVTSPGIISSRNYPSNYYNDEDCQIVIQAGEGQQVQLTILDMDIENQMSYCYDQLLIYDTEGALLANLCGNTTTPPFRSSGDLMTLYFMSDPVVTWRGYRARVSFVGVPYAFPAKVQIVKAWLGGFVGKIRVRITEVAENWRLEVTFKKDIFNLQISDCDAKLADLPGNGRNKKVFILNAEKDDKKILYPGDRLKIEFVAKISDCDAKLADLPGNGRNKKVFILNAEKDDKKILYPGDRLKIEFVAKVWKRTRGSKFDAVLYTNY